MDSIPITGFDHREFRTGIGYDLHRLEENRKLIIGGIEIPSKKGLVGHSDADILLHALTDALLGAISRGDIGEIFPPTDPQWKDVSSSVFLRHAAELLEGYGWKVANIDAVVILEQPRLLPYRDQILNNVASLLMIDSELISIKAKTGEGVGPIGTGQAAEAYAVVLVSRSQVPKLM